MSVNYICYNNKFYEEAKPILSLNRAMSFGDGLFETIRIKNSKATNLDLHFKRLKGGLDVLKIELSTKQWQEINTCLDQLIIKNEIEGGGRVKLIVFREGGGTYFPETNKASFYLKAESIDESIYVLNKKGIKIGIANSIRISPNFLSSYKTLNKIEHVLVSIEAQEKGFDDLLILNTRNKIVEASSSNIFLVKGRHLYTPPIKDGCLSGIMRYLALKAASALNLEIHEVSLTDKDILDADEIFLTNSIKGIQWVGSYSNKRYFNKVSQFLVSKLNS